MESVYPPLQPKYGSAQQLTSVMNRSKYMTVLKPTYSNQIRSNSLPFLRSNSQPQFQNHHTRIICGRDLRSNSIQRSMSSCVSRLDINRNSMQLSNQHFNMHSNQPLYSHSAHQSPFLTSFIPSDGSQSGRRPFSKTDLNHQPLTKHEIYGSGQDPNGTNYSFQREQEYQFDDFNKDNEIDRDMHGISSNPVSFDIGRSPQLIDGLLISRFTGNPLGAALDKEIELSATLDMPVTLTPALHNAQTHDLVQLEQSKWKNSRTYNDIIPKLHSFQLERFPTETP